MASIFSLGVLDINVNMSSTTENSIVGKINGKYNRFFSQSRNSTWKKVARNGNQIFNMRERIMLESYLKLEENCAQLV
jgi:phosphoribosyl-AMP cyclohydrolase